MTSTELNEANIPSPDQNSDFDAKNYLSKDRDKHMGQTILDAIKHVYYHTYTECCCTCVAPGRQAVQCSVRGQSIADEVNSRSSLSSPPCFPNCLEFSQTAPKESTGIARPQAERVVKPRSERREQPDDFTCKESRRTENSALTTRLKEALGNGSSFRKYERQEPIIIVEGDIAISSSSSSAVNTPACILVPPPRAKLAPIASCETLSESLDQIPGGSDDSCGSSANDSPVDECPRVMLPPNDAPCSPSGPAARLTPKMMPSQRKVAPTHHTPTPQCLQVPSTSLMGSTESELSPSSESFLCSTGNLVAVDSSCFGTSSVTCLLRSIPPASPHGSPKKTTATAFNTFRRSFMSRKTSAPSGILDNSQLDALALSPTTSPKVRRATSPNALSYCPLASASVICPSDILIPSSPVRSPVTSPKRNHARMSSRAPFSTSSSCFVHNSPTKPHSGKHPGCSEDFGASGVLASTVASQRCSTLAPDNACSSSAKVCGANTSCRHYKCTKCDGVCSVLHKDGTPKAAAVTTSLHRRAGPCDAVSHITRSHAATVRVLTILEHWIQKHLQDFLMDDFLRSEVAKILDDVVSNCNIMTNEHKRALALSKILAKNVNIFRPVEDLGSLLAPPRMCSKESFNTLSPIQIAEQMTYLDHQIFRAIRSEELLNQSWMKPDKAVKASHILLVSKRFNEASRLVVNEIVCRQTVQERAACIEKWAIVADICECMHNYNGVLQICAAFVNSAVYRLKKTWEKISKQSRQLIDRLQALVSSDGRFKNMRDALHRCDRPCIPYLGMYLTDLSFIEEGTANITEDGLINFSKMRMITQVIMEIQHFQQMSYQIEYMPKVTCYLLDTSKLMEEEETYNFSLEMEPRAPRLSVPGQFST